MQIKLLTVINQLVDIDPRLTILDRGQPDLCKASCIKQVLFL